MISKLIPITVLSFLISVSGLVDAAIDAYEFGDAQQQRRYENLVDELRCPQCLNTNLSGSDSMIAKDLRREIHRLVTEGESDDDVREFMYQRYGDFILYRPRFNSSTLLLWLGPLILLVVGFIFILRFVAERKSRDAASLTTTDQDRLQAILDKSEKE